LYAAIEELAGWIRSTYPGIYVVSIEIGNNSQGSIIVRDTLQRCSLLLFILITLSGIHKGVFGVPYLQFLPEPIRVLHVVTKYVYELPVQHTVSVANYWRDSTQLAKIHS
jgi:hypothetical protein